MHLRLSSYCDLWHFALWAVALLFPMPAVHAQEAYLGQAALVRSLIPTVVNITARTGIADRPETDQAGANEPAPEYAITVNAGSGFVIDPAGRIVTNWHVVADAFEIVVTFSDGTQVPAKIIGAGRVVDLALLKVEVGHPLQAVRWADSSKVEIGEPVLAMGNALGVGMSVSAGIISALNRNIGNTLVDDFIQTDAAINHGNSGGPLFDLRGRVIGVNSALISPTAANAGLGFAMPSNDAQYAIQHVMNETGAERPAWLGAKIQALTPEMAEGIGAPRLRGPIVAWVEEGSPAQRAGMHPGDVIQRFDGGAVGDERALLRTITTQKPGDQVTFGIWRNGQEIEVTATLGAWPKSLWEINAAPPPPHVRLTVSPDLGLTVTRLTGGARPDEDPIGPDVRGVLVTGVVPGCDAARRGLAPGDLVMRVGPNPVQTPEELWQEIDRARGENREFGTFLVLPKKPVAAIQWPGPKWIALRIAVK